MRNAPPPSGLLPLASWRRILWVVAAAAASVTDAAVYIDGRFSDGAASYESVAYFDLEDTPWKYVRPGEILTGPITVLTSKDFDDFFIDYQKRLILGDPKEQTDNDGNDDWVPDDDFFRNATSPREDDDAVFAETTLRDEVAGLPPRASLCDDAYAWAQPPRFLIVEAGSSLYSSSIPNIEHVAQWMGMDIVVLVVNRHASIADNFAFWWSHRFPGSSGKGIGSPSNDDDDADDGNDESTAGSPVSFVAVGAAQGQALLSILEEHGVYNTTNEDFYFGIDGESPVEGRYFTLRCAFYWIAVALVYSLTRDPHGQLGRLPQHPSGDEDPEDYVQFTSEDLGLGEVKEVSLAQASSSSPSPQEHDCCVCLEAMKPGDKVRILPCRHVFHDECIDGWFRTGRRFTCPMCKTDLREHLGEKRRAAQSFLLLRDDDDEEEEEEGDANPLRGRWWWQRLVLGRSITRVNPSQLIVSSAGDAPAASVVVAEGDPELPGGHGHEAAHDLELSVEEAPTIA